MVETMMITSVKIMDNAYRRIKSLRIERDRPTLVTAWAPSGVARGNPGRTKASLRQSGGGTQSEKGFRTGHKEDQSERWKDPSQRGTATWNPTEDPLRYARARAGCQRRTRSLSAERCPPQRSGGQTQQRPSRETAQKAQEEARAKAQPKGTECGAGHT